VLVASSKTIDEDVMKPFTIEQLRSLYYNFELEHVEEFVDTFLQVGEVLHGFVTIIRIDLIESNFTAVLLLPLSLFSQY
jgi:hypothetical protein